MDRRSFIKGLIALASAPAIGKYVNVFKTEGARKGIENVASQGVDFFNSVIKKVMDEGTLVKEEDRISTFKHPDRPDIVVDVNQTDGTSSVYFNTDEGGKAMGEIQKTADETTKGRTVEELFEQEEVYGPMGREPQEGITGGITNLEEFLKRKKGFAAGGPVVAPRDRVNNYLGYRPEDFNEKLGTFQDGTKISGKPMPMGLGIPPSSNNTNIIGNNNKRRQNIIEAMTQAKHSQGTIDDTLKILSLKNGGRVGMFRGGVPKGLQAAMQAIKSKFGDDAIKTVEETEEFGLPYFNIDRPEKAIARDKFKNFGKEGKFAEDGTPDYDYYADLLNHSEDTVVFGDETIEELEALAKPVREYQESMYDAYKTRKLDPEAGSVSQARLNFLRRNLEEAEMTGDRRLISQDEIEELEYLENYFRKDYLDFKAQQTDRKMTQEEIEELKELGEKGFKDGGEVSLTVIKIPDISESGVESLFKRR